MQPFIDKSLRLDTLRLPLLVFVAGSAFSAWVGHLFWSLGTALPNGLASRTVGLALFLSGSALALGLTYLLARQERLRAGAQQEAAQALVDLKQSRDEWALMLESTIDGMLRLDPQGNIIYANQASAQLLNYPAPASLLGAHVSTLRLPASEPAGVPSASEATASDWTSPLQWDKQFVTDTEHFVQMGGGRIPVNLMLTPLHFGGQFQGALLAFSDITAQKNSDTLLANERAHWRRILDAAPVGIAISYQTKVLFANPRYTELTGLQVGGTSVNTYVDQSDRFRLYEALKQNDVVYNFPLRVYNYKREIIDVMLSALNYEFEGKTALMSWANDVSQMRQAERAMEEAKRRAEEATHAKSAFLANMSHEIRTPMNAIIGMSHLALQYEMDAKPRSFIEKVHKASNNLLGIINDILDFSKIEADKLEVEHIDFSLDAVIDNLRSLIGLKAEEKGLGFHIDVAPGLPSFLVGDPLRLGQVLLNLGNNAVKFTEQGSVHIGIAQRWRDAEHIELLFSIKDTGIGMTPEQHERLFQAFNQADGSTTRKYGGTGLGLVISQRLVDLMDGTIWVDTEFGQGSDFQFTVKLGVGSASAAAPVMGALDRPSARVGVSSLAADAVGNARAAMRGVRLLLVEDNEMNQELAMELLTRAGADVTLAHHGAHALEILHSGQPFDGVLMDCQMPVMDGYKATRQLRQNPQWSDLPVIAMTANVMVGDLERAMDAGMNAHIAKPLNVAEMFTTIAHWIKPRHPLEPVDADKPVPDAAEQNVAQPLPPLPGIDTLKGLAYADHNHGLYHRQLQSFGRNHASFANRFGSALSTADWEAATRLAHTLKGTAGSIGALALQAASAELEKACLAQADGPQLRDCCLTVQGHLDTVLRGLQLLDIPASVQSAPTPGSLDAVAGLLNQLQIKCADSDPDAVDLVAGLVQASAGHPFENVAVDLARALETFDFDEAQEAITRLQQYLDPA